MALSRFDHVEEAPGPDGPEVAPQPQPLGRFDAEQEHEAPHQHLQVDPFQPGTAPQPLRRFDGDGGEGVGLELGHDREMPIKRCHRCHTDLSKFEERCHACGAPLDTDEARRFNEALWAEQKAQRAADEQATLERMYSRVRAGARDGEAVQDALERLDTAPPRWGWVWWLVTFSALGFGLWSTSGWVQLGCMVWVGLFLLTRISPTTRAYLTGLFKE